MDRAAGFRFVTSMITDRIGRHEVLLPIKVLQKEKVIIFFDFLKILSISGVFFFHFQG